MDIEFATVADAEAVADMWVTLASEQTQYGSHVLAERNRQSILDEVTRHAVTDRLLVARTDELVGFVMFTVERGTYELEVTKGIIENLFVDPAHRNEGVGSELLAAAERQLSSLGVDAIALEAMAANADARRFYRRHGYDLHRVKLQKRLESDNHSKEHE